MIQVGTVTQVGTCIVCQREIAVRPTIKYDCGQALVHHGYRRPGHGFIVGDCFSVDLPPHELAPDQALAYVAFARRCAADVKEMLANHTGGRTTVLHQDEQVPVPTTAFRPIWPSTHDPDPGWTLWSAPYRRSETDPQRRETWERLLKAAIRLEEARLQHYRGEVTRVEGLLETWTPQALRDRPAVTAAPTRRRRRLWR
jgi:hypothetical protein